MNKIDVIVESTQEEEEASPNQGKKQRRIKFQEYLMPIQLKSIETPELENIEPKPNCP